MSCTYVGLESLEESVELKAPTAENIKLYTTQIQDLVIARLNAAISCKLLQLVNVLHDSYTGDLLTLMSLVRSVQISLHVTKLYLN